MPLKVHVPGVEIFNESTNEFNYIKPCTFQIEHSLLSISKWESKWHKPFFSKDKKSMEELYSYIECMTITPNIDPVVYRCIPANELDKISEYLEDPMTATWFKKDNKTAGSREVVTSEIIYYWMVALQIPFECQKWHINRLLTLVKVCNEKNQPGKKMSKNDIFRQNAKLNAARRAALKSKG